MENKTMKRKLLILAAGFLPVFFTAGCFRHPAEEELFPVPGETWSTVPENRTLLFEATAVLDYFLNRNTFLIAGEIRGGRELDFYGFTPAGVQIFHVQNSNTEWYKHVLSAEQEKALSEFMFRGFQRILTYPHGKVTWETTGGGAQIGVIEKGFLQNIYSFSGKNSRLRDVTGLHKGREIWKIQCSPDKKRDTLHFIYSEPGEIFRLVVTWKKTGEIR